MASTIAKELGFRKLKQNIYKQQRHLLPFLESGVLALVFSKLAMFPFAMLTSLELATTVFSMFAATVMAHARNHVMGSM